ncbi:terminase small subunit [Candidatus Pacearchaeota archaeon]|nr:terminase small subunit [Candidatus Pacearchaeota archaeon]
MAKISKKKKKKNKNGGITPRISKFIDFFIETGDKAKSAERAKYSKHTAPQAASRLLKNVKILEEIEKRRAEIAEKASVDIQDVINELVKIGFQNSDDYFDWDECEVKMVKGKPEIIGKILLKKSSDICRDKKAAIAGIKETAKGGLELKFYDKNKALDSLGRILGASNDAEVAKAKRIQRDEQPDLNPDPTEGLSIDEVEDKIKELGG